MRSYFCDYPTKEEKERFAMHMRWAYDIEDDIVRPVRKVPLTTITDYTIGTDTMVTKNVFKGDTWHFMINDHDIVKWNGWQTTWGQLKASGWEISMRRKYNNWRWPDHCAESHDKIYLRHKENNMLGRITLYEKDDLQSKPYPIYILEFMIQEHNQRIRSKKIYVDGETVVNLTEQDIPVVLEAITKIQPRNKRKPLRKQAEVIEYLQRANAR